METKYQVFLIKGAYIFILLFYLIYNLHDLSRGFYDGVNGVEPKEKLTLLSGSFLLLGAIVGFAIVLKMYLFINSIQKKKVFNVINIKRISTLGWFCILQSFLLYGFYFSKTHFNFNQISVYKAIVSVNFEFWLLIFGVTLLTIGFVFKKGIELQQEQDLTI
jgi:hypothetical protein